MDKALRDFLIIDDMPINPCVGILQKAAAYYKEPLKDLQLKAPLEAMYAAADVDEVIGQWVSNVPRPGDVAHCLPKRKRGRE